MSGQLGSPRRTYETADVERRALQYRTWGKWGDDDELGSLNYVTPEKIAAAAGLIRRGDTFSLALPMDRNGPMPGISARVNPQHVMYRHGGDFLANWDEMGN